MRIFAFLEHLRNRRRQFKYDRYRVLVSLKGRPRNWSYTNYNGVVYDIKNHHENLEIWIANKDWGLHFSIEGRRYGGIYPLFACLTWRRQMYKAGIAAVENPWVNERLLDEDYREVKP